MVKKSDKEEKGFSTNQVGVLIEELKSDFRSVIEVVTPLPEKLEKVEDRLEKIEDCLSGVENKVSALESAVKNSLPAIHSRLTQLEAKVG